MRVPKAQQMKHQTATGVQWTSASEFSIEKDRYLARRSKSFEFAHRKTTEPFLATVIEVLDTAEIDASRIERVIKEYEEADDVYRKEFLHGVIFVCKSPNEIHISSDATALLLELGTVWTQIVASSSSIIDAGNGQTLVGPVIVNQNTLSEVWKVYDDFNHAFLVSTWSSAAKGEYENAHVAGESYSSLGVPVPSRLYYKRDESRPLNGLRVAIKDIFHLKGLKTSCASRAYQDLYPPQKTTAESVQLLVDLGALIVGKTHLSSFAWREEPTQCIDFQAPFNPRGDGYISPAASSSGSGAAIASYDWLDLALGTDTTGSGRRPALWNGSFALRPTLGTLSPNGMVPTCPNFDVPSLFTRDLATLKQVVDAWYSPQLQLAPDSSKPWKILYPSDYLPVDNRDQMRHIDAFTENLARWLNTTVETISIANTWKNNPPKEAKGVHMLHKYLLNIQEHGFFYDAYHCFDQFRDDYKKEFGREPYITDPVKWVWGLARIVDATQRETAFKKLHVFREWFNKTILKPHEQNAIMILPIEKLEARYRDAAAGWIPLVPPSGLGVLFMSPALEAPELVVPIGEIQYLSKVTEKTEYLPVAVSLLGATDSDLQIIEMVQKFMSENPEWRSSVTTGSRMWPVS